jgi:putative endonuclease
VKTCYVYILASRKNGTLYIGVTNDIVRRVYQHRHGITGGFASKYGATKLVWFEDTPNIAGAIQREKRLKKWPRAWKINLIDTQNPDWVDLYPGLVS